MAADLNLPSSDASIHNIMVLGLLDLLKHACSLLPSHTVFMLFFTISRMFRFTPLDTQLQPNTRPPAPRTRWTGMATDMSTSKSSSKRCLARYGSASACPATWLDGTHDLAAARLARPLKASRLGLGVSHDTLFLLYVFNNAGL